MSAGCFSGGVGKDSAARTRLSQCWRGELCRDLRHVNWRWGRCFNFSCEGSMVLDDESVPCLDHSPEAMTRETIAGCTVSETIQPQTEIVGDCGAAVLPCMKASTVCMLTHVDGNAVFDESARETLCQAIRKHSTRGYSSFEPSPPQHQISSITQTTKEVHNWGYASEELRPLLREYNTESCECEEVVNDLDYSVNKNISYNKVLPFSMISKSINTMESFATEKHGVEYQNDEKYSALSLGHENGFRSRKKGLPASLPTTPRETMVLCNDLDTDCQVVPLSFRPNLYPDMISVPHVNHQVSERNILPQRQYNSIVNTSCNNESFVTLMSQCKNPANLPASWPRRRPHSLRVAICYSDLKNGHNNTPVSSKQEIDMSNIYAQTQDISSFSSTTSFLRERKDILDEPQQGNKGNADPVINIIHSFKIDCKDAEEVQTRLRKDDSTVISSNFLSTDSRINVPEDCSVNSDTKAIVLKPVPQDLQIHCLPHSEKREISLYNDNPVSPNSDKENDPSLLSVRPKIFSSNSNHNSPKKKKVSPKKKFRSPMKQKCPDQSKKELLDHDNDPTKNNSSLQFGSLDDDFWAVDEFLPIPSRSWSQSLPRVLQVSNGSPANSKLKKTQSSIKSVMYKNSNVLDSLGQKYNALISTISSDTGYETESTSSDYRSKSELGYIDDKKYLKQGFNLLGLSLQDKNLSHSKPSSYSLLSQLSTPVEPISEPITPHTVADDTAEFFSVSSQLTNPVHASVDNVVNKYTGDETPDYLSITSEMPSVPRLPEDSPLTDFEMQQLFCDDFIEAFMIGADTDVTCAQLALDSEISPESGEPSTLAETPGTITRSMVEEEINESEEQLSGKQSPSGISTTSGSSSNSVENSPSHELVEIKYVQLSLSIVLAVILHAMQSISQFMLEIFLASDQEPNWD